MDRIDENNTFSALHLTLYLVIGTGILLAVILYIYNRSLWLDEGALALNIIDKSLLELTRPLDHNQVAPIGFLVIEKVSVLLLGKNEFALRAFPLLSYFICIPLLYALSLRFTKSRVISLTAIAIFSVSQKHLYYSSELKQYSSDVLVALTILYYTTSLDFKKNRSLFTYGIIGGVAIWLSNVSVIVLFASGTFTMFTEGYRRKNLMIFVPIICWAITFVLYYLHFIHDHPISDYMRNYWSDAFMPLDPFSREFYGFAHWAVRSVLSGLPLFEDYLWLIFVPIFVSLVAIKWLVTQKTYALLYFCSAIILVHLLLSSLSLYPFSGRLVIYISPLMILLISVGLHHLFEIAVRRFPNLPRSLFALPVLAIFLTTVSGISFGREEVKSSINYMVSNINDDDTIYVYGGCSRVFQFYTDTKFTNLRKEIVHGSAFHDEISIHDHELSKLKGKVWLIFAHVNSSQGLNHEEYIMRCLKNNGSEVLDSANFTGSTVYYIDTKIPGTVN